MRIGANTITYATSDLKDHSVTCYLYYPCLKRKMYSTLLNFVKVSEGLYRLNVNIKCIGKNVMVVFEDGVYKKYMELEVSYTP